MSDWVDVARRVVPLGVRRFVQRFVSLSSVKLRYRERSNPLSSVLESDANGPAWQGRFGIVRNAAQYHTHFVQACLEMQLPFRVLDLSRADWLQRVEGSGCDVLLAWPDAFLSTWGRMIKDRLFVLEHELGYRVVPSSAELWPYEDKRRMAYWLAANRVPHPETWVFYDEAEALAFAGSCPLPIVFKTSFGAAATGVEIVRSRARLARIVRRAFAQGTVAAGTDHRDREWGSVLLQEHLPEVREWRMVRIGDSFFGHPKGRVGEFHSGSGSALWDEPPAAHLDLLLDVTGKGGFRSMCVDVFETTDGRLLVNELQAVFGASTSVDQLRVGGQAGRFVLAGPGARWGFEPGDFARNACANERIRYAMSLGAKGVPPLEAAAAQGVGAPRR